MAYYGSSNAEFSAGVNHLTSGRANDNSITLNDTASMADQGLDQTSQRWAATTPHSVLRATVGGGSQDDGAWERLQRDADGYAPASMAKFQDQIDQGSDDNTA